MSEFRFVVYAEFFMGAVRKNGDAREPVDSIYLINVTVADHRYLLVFSDFKSVPQIVLHFGNTFWKAY